MTPRELRISKGLRHEDLACYAKISQGTVNSLEKKANPKISMLVKVAKVLGVSPTEYFAVLLQQYEKVNTKTE